MKKLSLAATLAGMIFTLLFSSASLAQGTAPGGGGNRPVLIGAPPPGKTEFKACCGWCGTSPGSCHDCATNGNQACAADKIAANCGMVQDKVTCDKASGARRPEAPSNLSR